MSNDSSRSSDSEDSGESSVELSSGLLDIRLERELRKVLRTPLEQDFLRKCSIKVQRGLSLKDKMRAIMDKVFNMDMETKLEVLKETKCVQFRASRERHVWHTYKLKGQEPVTSPRGRRKIARRIQQQLNMTVEVSVETFEEAVWVVVFSRSQLQKLTQARSMTQLTATVFVWYAGEPALYSNRSKCNPHMLSAVCTTLGYASSAPIRLSGKRLSTMRVLFMAKEDKRFLDHSLPVEEHPVPF